MVEENKTDEKEPNVTLTVTAGSFPMSLFLEWDKDCKDRFGHCRWMKMWHDHLAAKQVSMLSLLMTEIETLKLRLDRLEKKPVKKEEEVKTLGRND